MRKLACAAALIAAPLAALAQDSKVDNGTDPSKVSRNFTVSAEHLDLRGTAQADILLFRYTTPLPGDGRTGLQFKLPFQSTNLIDRGFGLGDVSAKLTRVLAVTPQYGVVVSGEVVLDSADRADRGAGVGQVKLGLIYARFLKDGSIFAPALFHSESFGTPDAGRSRISNTILDFYYVPRLANPKNYMTLDPAIKMDWKTDTLSSSLAVTYGIGIDTGLAGNSSVFIKPSVGIGGNREFDWGLEVGFKVVGF